MNGYSIRNLKEREQRKNQTTIVYRYSKEIKLNTLKQKKIESQLQIHEHNAKRYMVTICRKRKNVLEGQREPTNEQRKRSFNFLLLLQSDF